MIETRCGCGAQFRVPEGVIGGGATCSRCGRAAQFVCAEALPEGAGAGDFDASVVVVSGPGDVGRRFFIGGISDIEIGRLPERHITLAGGTRVSRLHCKLARVDFGPSRWRVEDAQSMAGVRVNGRRVSGLELTPGAHITIGDYELRYEVVGSPGASRIPTPASLSDLAGGGPVCPSCEQALPLGTRICVGCGIDVHTGRPLLTAHGLDEDEFCAKAESTIRLLSWVMPLGLYPIGSEAFGTRRPYATWAIAAVTVLASLCAWVAGWARPDEPDRGLTARYALWVGAAAAPGGPSDDEIFRSLLREDQRVLRQMTPEQRQEVLGRLRAEIAATSGGTCEFRWYQLLTHALLHGDVVHLAGNILFLLVFGTRVNALIGNVKTAVLYPLLAVAGGVGHMLASAGGPRHPMVGASGAIMGLAGMYLLLFPVHKVYMTAWLRFGLAAGFRLAVKIWQVRGFWVVLFYISFDVLYTSLGIRDNVAHWAHLGGFITGTVVALLLLVSRLVNARGGDMLSVILGKRAWPLIGRPARWRVTANGGRAMAR